MCGNIKVPDPNEKLRILLNLVLEKAVDAQILVVRAGLDNYNADFTRGEVSGYYAVQKTIEKLLKE
jgi:hypothetical protein